MNTALFLLRAKQIGLGLEELNYLTMGMVLDMITESGNDSCKYEEIATKDDFAKF